MATTVGLGTRGISLHVDRGLTSGNNTKSSQMVYKFINSFGQPGVIKPVKSSMKIVVHSKERVFYSLGSIFPTSCFMLPSDFKLKRVGASHTENGTTSRMLEVGIGVFIVKDKKILLGRRRSALVAGNNYNLPGGHLEYGETFEEGITREMKEETGLDITNIEVITTANHILSDVHAVVTYMHASLSDPNQTPQNIEPEKCEGWGWYDIENLPEPMFEPLREMLQYGILDPFATRN